MDVSGGIFQIRPHKEFIPAKGRERLLSLHLLSELPCEDVDNHPNSDLTPTSEPKNAYDFMTRRREIGADPALKRWNASIRLSNFTSVQSSPLCVRTYYKVWPCLLDVCPDRFYRGAAWSSHSATRRERIGRRRPRRSGNSWPRDHRSVCVFLNTLSRFTNAYMQRPSYANKCGCFVVCGNHNHNPWTWSKTDQYM